MRAPRHPAGTWRAARGFTLVELLVALAVFAAMAAIAWTGLARLAQARGDVAQAQADLRSIMLAVDTFDLDLRQAVARPVRGNYGEPVLAFVGSSDRLEFCHLGFANPLEEQRANLERVGYAFVDGRFSRANYPVLDRAPSTQAQTRVLREHVTTLRLRYMDAQRRWVGSWPAPNAAAGSAQLPRAVELQIETPDYGVVTRTVELPADFRGRGAPP